ncbi:hypothetical protein Tcan_17249 [Toxocara canis]|uniref:HAT C-terminal dimerisation domain-containing protein n=2 Tax=Toxocara canis TaxID=6265 RepID=A0A0B2VWG1_TOXCA|nr:hypothetical protein Tcan_17249 [Toxocara canis]
MLHSETGNAGCEEVTAVSISNDEDNNASTCSDGDLFDSGEDEIDDFEEPDKKIGLDRRFPKRLSCMAHTLQLALAGGLKASGCRAKVDGLIRVVGKFRKTRLAAERLHARSGLDLAMPCSIRWNSSCYAVERYLRVKDAVVEVAKEMGWDMQMVTRNTKLYEGLVSVTKPIKDRPRRYSEVGRKNSMNVYAHEDSTVANVARCENKEFKRRVAKVIDPNSPDFHPIYAVATVLDPNNACLFDNGLKEVAETALLSMARVEDENANSLVVVETPAEPLDHPTMLQQTAKSGDYAKIILQQKKNMKNAVGSDSLKCATATYVASVFYEPPDSPVNPIAYWETEKKVHRALKAMALRVLSTPASSTPVERVFSQAGIITGGRRLRMEQVLLEKKLFLYMNRAMWSSIHC